MRQLGLEEIKAHLLMFATEFSLDHYGTQQKQFGGSDFVLKFTQQSDILKPGTPLYPQFHHLAAEIGEDDFPIFNITDAEKPALEKFIQGIIANLGEEYNEEFNKHFSRKPDNKPLNDELKKAFRGLSQALKDNSIDDFVNDDLPVFLKAGNLMYYEKLITRRRIGITEEMEAVRNLLKVELNTDPEDQSALTKAWRQFSLKKHPDRNPNQTEAEMDLYSKISNAYTMWTNNNFALKSPTPVQESAMQITEIMVADDINSYQKKARDFRYKIVKGEIGYSQICKAFLAFANNLDKSESFKYTDLYKNRPKIPLKTPHLQAAQTCSILPDHVNHIVNLISYIHYELGDNEDNRQLKEALSKFAMALSNPDIKQVYDNIVIPKFARMIGELLFQTSKDSSVKNKDEQLSKVIKELDELLAQYPNKPSNKKDVGAGADKAKEENNKVALGRVFTVAKAVTSIGLAIEYKLLSHYLGEGMAAVADVLHTNKFNIYASLVVSGIALGGAYIYYSPDDVIMKDSATAVRPLALATDISMFVALGSMIDAKNIAGLYILLAGAAVHSVGIIGVNLLDSGLSRKALDNIISEVFSLKYHGVEK